MVKMYRLKEKDINYDAVGGALVAPRLRAMSLLTGRVTRLVSRQHWLSRYWSVHLIVFRSGITRRWQDKIGFAALK